MSQFPRFTVQGRTPAPALRKPSSPFAARAPREQSVLLIRRSLLGLAIGAALPAFAQETPQAPEKELKEVVVTGNPLGSEAGDLAAPVSVLGGKALVQKRESTLGETVSGLPGVSSTYFGPNASRPVIRGMDGDRVRMLEGGVGAADASSVSYDHATTIDPLVVEKIEVLRGPAALLYGGNAVGGVVNALDGRIPTESPEGVSGRGEMRLGGAADERGGAAILEFGDTHYAVHADGFSRHTDDLRIPGAAVSDRLRTRIDAGEAEVSDAVAAADGRLPASSSSTKGGALGGSVLGNWGYAGLSYSRFDSNYGAVAEPDVRIDMKSERVDFAGEWRAPFAGISKLAAKLRHNDYEHVELEGGETGTRFASRGWEGRLEATHAPIGRFTGAFGLQWGDQDFSALGEEAFVPKTRTRNTAGFLLEEANVGDWKFSLGGRIENSQVDNEGGERFDPADSRSFDMASGAFGVVWNFAPEWALASNLTHSERAPTFYELYANGPHVGTGAYEVGDRSLSVERSNALDLQLRFKRASGLSASVGAYLTRFANYVALSPTGQSRGTDGSYNPAPDEESLPEYAYAAVPAQFAGLEGEARIPLADGALGRYALGLTGDLVRAKQRDTGEALPRIPAARLGAALDWDHAAWGARLEVQHAFAQDRVAENELPTDGYTLLNLSVSYRMQAIGGTWDVWLKGSNLTNAEARNATSFLKDIAPLGGRAVLLGVRADY